MNAKPSQPAARPFLSAERLASLSDTMFGVAMTLVVTTLLPAIQAHKGSVLDMLPEISGELTTVVLSFVISARYWVLQQQRLALTRSVTPFQTWLHMVFLFLIVLVPISTSLDGLTGADARRGEVIIYGSHLFLLALVNLLLSIEVHRTVAAHLHVVRSWLSVGLLGVALVAGAIWPGVAVYVWFAALPTPTMARLITRRFYPPSVS